MVALTKVHLPLHVCTVALTFVLTLSEAAIAADDAVARCADLVANDLSQLPDAPTKIVRAQWFDESEGLPSHCHLQGYVWPSVGFEMRLPSPTWNGKLLKAGCGGFCGSTSGQSYNAMATYCDGAVRRGYACIASDMGHSSSPGDGIWSFNNLHAEVDWGYRATHVATIAGKAIVDLYFNSEPERTYFFGCSTGGRQGLVAAQRFPWDFDGIIAGAPPIEHLRNTLNVLWNFQAVLDGDGKFLLTHSDIELLHHAVLQKCDLDDGLKDGIIDDPRNCEFDPGEILCGNGDESQCLTAPQVEAVKKLYSGPTTFSGEFSSVGPLMPGSELNWSMYLSQEGLPYQYQLDKFRYQAFMPDAGPQWQLSDLDFAVDAKRLGLMDALYAANNPDLRKFKTAGGKLILFQGWGDAGDFPLAATDYYETTERAMGGQAATQEFFRLFMIPGMGHCTGGAGAYFIDYLSYLEAWVEDGEPPDKLIGAHPKDPKVVSSRYGLDPLDPAEIEFTRPIFPYPARAKYKGSGNWKDAVNFEPVFP